MNADARRTPPLFAVRYCGPAEYAARVLLEFALFAGLLYVLAMVPWCRHLPHPVRVAAVAVFAGLAVLDVALLRVRRGRS